MKRPKVDKEIIARDAFFQWKVRAKSARNSVTIFTPYLDRVASRILSAAEGVVIGNRVLVTCVNAETLLHAPSQLHELKRLLSDGHPVYHLDGLHAKVLLVDESRITVGSQNFTGRGRRNREITGFPRTLIDDSALAAKLVEWREAATVVDEEYIDKLIELLAATLRKQRKTLRATQKLIDQCHVEWLEAKSRRQQEEAAARKRREQDTQDRLKREHEEQARRAKDEDDRLDKERLARLSRLAEQSRIKLQGGPVYARTKVVARGWDWNSGYTTLLVWGARSLTSWATQEKDGSWKPYDLNRLAMYPAYFSDTGRMGFVRLASSRISYVRASVTWDPEILLEGGQVISETSFSMSDVARRNIAVTIKGSLSGICRAELRFTGAEIQLIDVAISDESKDDADS